MAFSARASLSLSSLVLMILIASTYLTATEVSSSILFSVHAAESMVSVAVFIGDGFPGRFTTDLSPLRLYLICGFTGNVFSHVFAPKTVSVGASTALFGLIGAQAIFIYKNRRIMRNYRAALRNIAFVLVVNLMIGLSGGIDNWGHLGGLAGALEQPVLVLQRGPGLKYPALW